MQPQLPEWVWYTDRLSEKRIVVRYDPRGSGMSDRNVTDFSLDSLECDLEAVVNAVGLERFALMAMLFTGPVAIAYAARHPEQLSHLLLWCAYASGRDYADLPAVKAFQALRMQDWEIYTQTGAHAFLGWAAADHASGPPLAGGGPQSRHLRPGGRYVAAQSGRVRGNDTRATRQRPAAVGVPAARAARHELGDRLGR